MSFPASQNPLAIALAQAQATAAALKGQSQSALAQMQAGPVSANLVLQVFLQCFGAKTTLNTLAAVPGLGAYAQAQYNNNTFDIVTEFNNMITLINAVGSWILSNFPTDTGGFIQKDKIDGTNGLTTSTFTTAQTAGLQTALSNLIADIS